MYTDADGKFKGDALIVFFKPQSVDMAIMLLDDTDFRFTTSGADAPKMRVQAADSSYKKTKYDGENSKPAEDSSKNNNITNPQPNNGNNNNNNRRNDDKAKIIKKTQKLSAKLADWGDDDEPSALPSSDPNFNPAPPSNLNSSKQDRTVILSHMFTLSELQEDPTALLDIKEDIREECAKLGPVTNVVLYDEEEEGIVSVKFQTREAAEACVRVMHGRAFAGQIVGAYFATGKEKFRRSKGEVLGRGEDE
jgi:HIV Tat-specific factor 1